MRYEGKVGGSSRVPATVPMLYHPIRYGMLGKVPPTSPMYNVILPLPSSSCMCMPSHRNTMCAVSLPLPARDAFLTSYCDGTISYVYGRRTRACRTVYYSIGTLGTCPPPRLSTSSSLATRSLFASLFVGRQQSQRRNFYTSPPVPTASCLFGLPPPPPSPPPPPLPPPPRLRNTNASRHGSPGEEPLRAADGGRPTDFTCCFSRRRHPPVPDELFKVCDAR